MTYKEAIKNLRNRRMAMSPCIEKGSCKENNQAIDIAIKALRENEELKARLKNAIELPCKFGSSVYVLMQRGLKTDIVKSTVENIRRYSGDTWWVEFSSLWVDKTLDDFGKTVFITREDAEKALKERDE